MLRLDATLPLTHSCTMTQTSTLALIGAVEAAKRLGMHRQTFNKLAAAGEVPAAMQLPGRTGARLFDPAVIDALADQQEQA